MDLTKAVDCTEREATMLRELLREQQQHLRDVQVAFTMFVKAHDLPDESQLDAVTADGKVLIKLPQPPAADG